MNQTNDMVRLAYVDFWGKRKNTDVYIEDIISPELLPKSIMHLYTPIQICSNDCKFKILHRFGEVLDPEKYTYTFGEYY